jgi:hypothetical protein
MNVACKLLAASVLSAAAAAYAGPAGAAPITAPSSLRSAVTPAIQTVQWRRGRLWSRGYYDAYTYVPAYHGYAAGYAYYAPTPPAYVSGDYAYFQGPSYTVELIRGAGAYYCAQRFRSYHPASRTHMGYHAERRPCP